MKTKIFRTMAIAALAVAVATAACKKSGEDGCPAVRLLYKAMQEEYQVMRDSCMNYYFPTCMEVAVFRNNYFVSYDRDSLTAAIGRADILIHGGIFHLIPLNYQEAMFGVSRTGKNADSLRTKVIPAFYEANKKCLE